MKLFFIRGGLFLFSLLGSLISLELLLHINSYPFHVTQFSWINNSPMYKLNSELIYQVQPNINDPENDFYTNALGLKASSAEESVDKNNNYIIILGDSFVWGNTPNHQTYPVQLEQLLKQKYPNIKVLNAGISGYGTDQEFIFFTKYLLPYIKPKILIWNININDIYDNINHPLFDIKNGTLTRLPIFIHGIYLNAKLANILPEPIKRSSKLANWISYQLEKIKLFKNTGYSESTWSIAKLAIQARKMRILSNTYGFKLIFSISPSQSIIENLPSKDDHLAIVERIKEAINDPNLINQNDYLLSNFNMSSLLSDDSILGQSTVSSYFLDETDKFPPGWWHPNEFGNYLMALSVKNLVVSYLDTAK